MAKKAKHAEAKAAASATPVAGMLEEFFGLKAQGTDIRTELIAGLTTFLTMVYIIFVNPRSWQCRHGQGRGVRRDLHRRRGIARW